MVQKHHCNPVIRRSGRTLDMAEGRKESRKNNCIANDTKDNPMNKTARTVFVLMDLLMAAVPAFALSMS